MLITLAGPDGVGKSTQAKLLYNWYLQQGHRVTILDKWDILNHATQPECRFIGGSLDDLRLCIAEMQGESRALFLFWSIFQTMIKIDDLHSNENIYISDGYWIKHAASEVLYGNDEKWIRAVTAAFPASDYIFYFNADADTTAERKKDFTAYECGRHSEKRIDQFLQHQRKLKKIMDAWCEQEGWISVNATQEVGEVFAMLQRSLKREMHNA